MEKFVLIHIPHSSLYIPEDYKKTALISQEALEEENLFMCDARAGELLDDKSQAVVFPYSRLFCDVERFKDESEVMNKYGMGYIYTRSSKGEVMFRPSEEHKNFVSDIYDEHHRLLDERVTEILQIYGRCVIIDLHSYSTDTVNRLFGYQDVPDICIGIENDYSSEKLTEYFIEHFKSYGYSVEINFPYTGSLVPNAYYGKTDTGIVSIMIEINKRVYMEDFDKFKKILQEALEFKEEDIYE